MGGWIDLDMIRKVTLILFLIICSGKAWGQEVIIGSGPIYFSTGIQITLKMLSMCTSNQKTQPSFPNPTIIKEGMGWEIRSTHILRKFFVDYGFNHIKER